ncbi:hypothetical protein F7725_025673 [Dissostichus mawsoni]|uniref:MYND-type domain-containing protein n=1 Tax=Dissostichus mawsoni TaxID=36200 RepID=A0A7J5XCQ8_DISMA|nr:hypothetical protein F7725_025673 [Dissostichus mawsoni]
MLLGPSLLKGRDSDGFPQYQEKFIRDCIRKFPYCEATLLQELVRSIAPVEIGNDPTAFSVLNQAITGQMAFVDANYCATCGEKGADKRCSLCKAVTYCSLSCQKLHWFAHKKMCRCLQEQDADLEKDSPKLKELKALLLRCIITIDKSTHCGCEGSLHWLNEKQVRQVKHPAVVRCRFLLRRSSLPLKFLLLPSVDGPVLVSRVILLSGVALALAGGYHGDLVGPGAAVLALQPDPLGSGPVDDAAPLLGVAAAPVPPSVNPSPPADPVGQQVGWQTLPSTHQLLDGVDAGTLAIRDSQPALSRRSSPGSGLSRPARHRAREVDAHGLTLWRRCEELSRSCSAAAGARGAGAWLI